MSGWNDLSPDVAAVLGDGERRQQDRKLSKMQKKERARQKARVRVTYDVPDWLKDEIFKLAEAEECSASSLGAWLLAIGIRAYRQDGKRPSKHASDSPRFEFIVDVDESDAGL